MQLFYKTIVNSHHIKIATILIVSFYNRHHLNVTFLLLHPLKPPTYRGSIWKYPCLYNFRHCFGRL